MARSHSRRVRPAVPDDEIPERKPNWVVRAGIAILGLAVAISSLVPLLSMFAR